MVNRVGNRIRETVGNRVVNRGKPWETVGNRIRETVGKRIREQAALDALHNSASRPYLILSQSINSPMSIQLMG